MQTKSGIHSWTDLGSNPSFAVWQRKTKHITERLRFSSPSPLPREGWYLPDRGLSVSPVITGVKVVTLDLTHTCPTSPCFSLFVFLLSLPYHLWTHRTWLVLCPPSPRGHRQEERRMTQREISPFCPRQAAPAPHRLWAWNLSGDCRQY